MNEKNSAIAKASHPAWGVKSQGLNSKGLAVEEVSGGTCGLFRYNAKNLTLLCINPTYGLTLIKPNFITIYLILIK
jgi:hypothetical protein